MAESFSLGASQVKELKKQIVLEVKAEYPSADANTIVTIFDTALKNLMMTEAEESIDTRILPVVGAIST
jgi:hypothetical protein